MYSRLNPVKLTIASSVLALLLPLFSRADCNSPKVLYFANGMFNDRVGANESKDELQKKLQRKYPSDKFATVKLAFNTDEAALIQLHQVFRQKVTDINVSFWKSFANLLQVNPKDVSTILSKYIAVEKLLDVDLSLQIKSYQASLKNGWSIITVAHSQGNFYTNSAFDNLNVGNMTSMISVATPASRVFQDGPYFTFKSDGIIGLFPTALSPNLTKEPAGLFDHEFIKHYLGDKTTHDQILLAVHETYNNATEASEPSLDPAARYFDNDVVPILNYYKEVVTQRSLLPGQCLLAWQLFDVYARHGATCTQRNFAAFKEGISDCLKDLNDKNQERRETNCPFYRGMDFGSPYQAYFPAESHDFFTSFPDCKMSFNDFHEQEGLNEATAALVLLQKLETKTTKRETK